jgi:hypothetical protein
VFNQRQCPQLTERHGNAPIITEFCLDSERRLIFRTRVAVLSALPEYVAELRVHSTDKPADASSRLQLCGLGKRLPMNVLRPRNLSLPLVASAQAAQGDASAGGRRLAQVSQDVGKDRLCLAKAAACSELLAQIRTSNEPVFRARLTGSCLRPFVESRAIAAKAEMVEKSVHAVGKVYCPRGAGIERSVHGSKQVRQLPPRDCPHCGDRLAVLIVQKTG